MVMLARDLRLMSLRISGIGRRSSERGRRNWGARVIVSTLRPGMTMAGVGAWDTGVSAPDAGVDERETPLEPPLALLLAPQMGATLGALPLGAPSSGNSSCDWVSRAACLGFAALTAGADPEADASSADLAGSSSSCTSSTVTWCC